MARAPVSTMSGTIGLPRRIPRCLPQERASGRGPALRLRRHARGKDGSGGICCETAVNGMTPCNVRRLIRDRRGFWGSITEPAFWRGYIVSDLTCQGKVADWAQHHSRVSKGRWGFIGTECRTGGDTEGGDDDRGETGCPSRTGGPVRSIGVPGGRHTGYFCTPA